MSTSNASAIQSIYDERSEGYDDSFHGELASDFVEWADLREGDSLLDLACGTGLVTIPAKKEVKNGRVVGIDFSSGMLGLAQRKAKQDGLDIAFYRHDISNLDDLHLGNQSFQVITCAAALLLMEDKLAALKHWIALLVPGGRLVTDLPMKHASLPIGILGELEGELGVSFEWDAAWAETGEPLKKLLTDAGLVVDKVFTTKAYRTTAHHLDTAAELFAKAVASPMCRKFGRPDIRDKAERLFIDRFRHMADEDGLVHEVVKMHIGIAHKGDQGHMPVN
ncbi:S-adenosyl-L-methionine-dependent methyltransferase [Delphinella strobiligena]|nr:S-adenosyl-L-methionine-dependent methyltransferase [Delphinella strobiligena]